MAEKNNKNNDLEESQLETSENSSSAAQNSNKIPEIAGRIGGYAAGRKIRRDIAKNINSAKHSDIPNDNNGINPNTPPPIDNNNPVNSTSNNNNQNNQQPQLNNNVTENAKPNSKKNPTTSNSQKTPQIGLNGNQNKKSATSASQNTGEKSPNPSRRFNPKNIASKHSKHSDGNDTQIPSNETRNSKNPLEKLKNKTKSEKNIPNATDAKNTKRLVSGASKVASAAAGAASKMLSGVVSFIMSSPVVIITGFVIVLAVLLGSLIAPIIASLQPYGEDDDGNVCFATATCTKVILKTGEEEKKYELDEYIAGAMVNYYEYSKVVKYTFGQAKIDDDLLKALAVVIHSDISIYSDYDSTNSTCTITESSRFKEVYEPTENNTNSDDNVQDDGDTQGETTDNPDESDNTENSEQETNSSTNENSTDEKQSNDDKYYYKAKSAANSVISEVVDTYSKNLELNYSGYSQVLHDAVDNNKNYKEIVKIYIENDPNYASNNSSNDEDNEDNDESTNVYPICYFEKTSDGTGEISYSNNICSTVHVNNGASAGDYTIDKFIEGVVYNEARAWNDSLDTLKAHAVAARTYLVNRGTVENDTCYITVGGNTMGFNNATTDVIHQAVTETSGEYIMVNGEISKAAEWDALCITNPDTTGSYYTICQKSQQIPKDWFSKVKLFNSIKYYNEHSHGRGMSQYGAYYLATVQNKSYKEIINYYYNANVGTVVTESKKGYVMPINTFSYISGETTGYCDNGKVHTGIDFVAAKGTPVYAAHSGTVVKLYNTNYQCGVNCKSGEKEGLGVKIDNGDGTHSLYMHFSSRENLTVGQTVEAGQKIGEVGNTGSARGKNGGYHLHYQMQTQNNGTRTVLNPRDYLPLDEKGYGVCYKPR